MPCGRAGWLFGTISATGSSLMWRDGAAVPNASSTRHVPDINGLADVNREHIFSSFKRSGVGPSRLLNDCAAAGTVGIHGQPRLDPGEQFTGLLGSGVTPYSFGIALGIDDFMYQDVDALRVLDQILGGACIS